MTVPSAPQLLIAWETGLAQESVERALTLLGAAYPGVAPAELAVLPLGRRDVLLLELRERLFGKSMVSLAECPQCGEQLELAFETTDIRVMPPTLNDADVLVDMDALVIANFEAYEVTLRLPNSADMMALSRMMQRIEGVDSAKSTLFELCVVQVFREGQAISAAELPDFIVDAGGQLMAEADPQADVELALCCPQCGYEWQAALDIAGFLWSEVHAWALRLLREVHVLASAYGWREADILALSGARRQWYLELVGA